MGVVYFSIIPTFEPSRYCKCWIVCFYYNYDLFMKLDISSKTEIFRGFKEDYIPWWENDVVNHMVDGVPKKFTVYLVD